MDKKSGDPNRFENTDSLQTLREFSQSRNKKDIFLRSKFYSIIKWNKNCCLTYFNLLLMDRLKAKNVHNLR